MTDLAQTYLPLRADLQSWSALPLFPADFAAYPDDSLLDRLYLIASSVEEFEESLAAALEVAWEGIEEVSFPLLGAQGIALVLGGSMATNIGLTVTFAADKITFALTSRVGLRFDATLIRPVVLENGVYRAVEGGIYEIAFEDATVTLDTDGNLDFQNLDTIALAPFAIGDTGVVVVPGTVTLCFSSDSAAGLMATHPDAQLTADFRGVFIADGSVVFPDDFPIESVSIRSAFIGNQGFTGTVQATRGDAGLTERGACMGFPFSLTSVSLTFVQNAITGCAISGTLTIPFIDRTVDVNLGLGLDGTLTLALADPQGLASLEIPQVGTLKLTSLGFAVADQGVGVLISGSLLLSVADLQWPEVGVQSLCIRPNGEVSVPGGWIDLQAPLAVDLFGFRMEMSAIGFGKEDDGRSWIGFSGGVNLIDLLPTGVSVEGLRILWNPSVDFSVDLTLQGVGIELTAPGVLHLDGSVSLMNDGDDHYFTGSATLDLSPLGISLDASIKLGHDSALDYNYVYVFLSLELPVGIPLWATGAAIYGIAGLLGINVEPTTTNGDWYGWYAAPPEFNITDAGKWRGELGSMAFGAGIVIGTLFDAGWTVSTKSLLALLLPGPTILFNGKANILQFPPGLLESSEASLNLLALLDGNAGDLMLNIDAGWELKQIVDLSASAEAYFQFSRPDNWHLYLGQDQPESRRIRAYVIALFNADAYLMIDADGIAAGFRVSYGQDWRFGPVAVALTSWIEAGAALTWQPVQLEGSLSLGGEFAVSIAGFGVGIAAQATLSGKTPTPYWVRGELALTVNLPAPIKDLEQDILLEWKQDLPPDLADPLRTISLEHLKVSETWQPSLSGSALAPTDGGFEAGPVVPLDARPLIVFDRSVRDSSGLNNVNAAYAGGTAIGDYTFDYELESDALSLEMWSKAGAGGWSPFPSADLSGAWTAELDGMGRAVSSKLQIMAKTPFAFTRRTSRTYADWFLASNPNWLCGDGATATVYCVDWTDIHEAQGVGTIYPYQNLTFIARYAMWLQPAPRNTICRIDGTSGLYFAYTLWIQFPEPVRRVELCLEGSFEAVRAYSGGTLLAETAASEGTTVIEASGIDWLEVVALIDDAVLASVCYTTEAEAASVDAETVNQQIIEANAFSWSSEDPILPPDTYFRLKATVTVTRKRGGAVDDERAYTHYAYFQTAAPPALTPGAQLPAPAESSALETGHYPAGDLADLRTYIANLIPAHGGRAVYRAYDLGAEFNENYVEQMYGADMAIRLRDANDQPILDEDGGEIQFANQWAKLPTSELSTTEIPYITRIEDCVSISVGGIAANHTFSASYGVLFAEDFSGTLDAWTDVDAPDGSTDDNWVAENGMLIRATPILSPLGALLVAGDPTWGDYAVEAELTSDGDEVGLVVRYRDDDADGLRRCYRLRLNAGGRSFERITGSDVVVLWQDSAAYTPAAGLVVAIQCLGQRLRGQLGGELLFDLVDGDGFTTGRIGLYTNTTAAFERVLVRDYPGAALAAETLYRAELIASYVLYQADGWQSDPAAGWLELVETDGDRRRIAVFGQDTWADYRFEATFTARSNERVGFLFRFQLDSDGVFECYRLLFNPADQSVRLAQLAGSCDLNTGTYTVTSRMPLIDCAGASCAIDFNLTEHDLALTCEGDQLRVEIDGNPVTTISDASLTSGKVGLYYNGTAATPTSFAGILIRSTPKGKVFGWQFSTSAFPGFVEHLDSFAGVIYPTDTLLPSATDLTAAISTAVAALADASNTLLAARSDLAASGTTEFADQLAAVTAARVARDFTASEHYQALFRLFFGETYRPRPPVVELTELLGSDGRYALLLESPEPLDWNRITFAIKRRQANGDYNDIRSSAFIVWSDDGTRALILATNGAVLPSGIYMLQLAFNLDIGAEMPVLRRNGSTIPETVALDFDLR
ncbi:MAG: hypothetical protein IT319_11435 [Anaerolineae bacterium]|nr:hypothetical protein [Anaerolineae bacterium]